MTVTEKTTHTIVNKWMPRDSEVSPEYKAWRSQTEYPYSNLLLGKRRINLTNRITISIGAIIGLILMYWIFS